MQGDGNKIRDVAGNGFRGPETYAGKAGTSPRGVVPRKVCLKMPKRIRYRHGIH